MEILTNLDLVETQTNEVQAKNVFITLTTTPPRLLSDDFEKTLACLSDQSHIPEKIIINIPYKYKRNFGKNATEREIEKRIKYLEQNFTLLYINRCETDFGPATKLLGALDGCENLFKDESILIVVDDDIEYSRELVWSHLTAHTIYQCEISAIDQKKIIQQWEPYRFHKHTELFAEDTELRLYGFLSFAIRFRCCTEIMKHFQSTWKTYPESFFHDDAVFSDYARAFDLYKVRINIPSIRFETRLEIDGKAGYALRDTVESSELKRLEIENNIDNQAIVNRDNFSYRIAKSYQTKSIYNVKNAHTLNNSRTQHGLLTFVNDQFILLTVSLFNDDYRHRSIDVLIQVDKKVSRVSLNMSSTKASYLLDTGCVVKPIIIQKHKELPVMQTFETTCVSKHRLYSVCTVIGNTLGHKYNFYDAKDRNVFIKKHASAIIHYAYNLLATRAYQADLFRYLYLYIKGGAYLDCKSLLCKPLHNILTKYRAELDSISVADKIDGYISNSFLFFKDIHSKILKSALTIATFNVINKRYGLDSLSITGPGIFKEISLLRDLPQPQLANKYLGDSLDWRDCGIFDQENELLIVNQYQDYYDENNYLQDLHYSVQYNEKRVFKNGNLVKHKPWALDIFNGIDCIHWINLDRSTFRREHMEQMLKNINIKAERIQAFDGKKALPVQSEGFSSSYQIGCLLSHLYAIKKFSSQEGEYFLVLEDDMELSFLPLLRGVDTVRSIVRRAPPDWEVIMLSWIYPFQMHEEFTDWTNKFNSGPEGHIAGTGAYIINKKGVNKINRIIVNLDDKNIHANALLSHADGHKLIADVYLYGLLRTYVYRNRFFRALSQDSFINPNDVDWHLKTQSIILNKTPGAFPAKTI